MERVQLGIKPWPDRSPWKQDDVILLASSHSGGS